MVIDRPWNTLPALPNQVHPQLLDGATEEGLGEVLAQRGGDRSGFGD